MIKIKTEPDMSIEPGHQWLVFPKTAYGYFLARLLADCTPIIQEVDGYRVAHTHTVDCAIVDLIDALAHVRFSAPNLVQIMLPTSEPVVEEDGLEGR